DEQLTSRLRNTIQSVVGGKYNSEDYIAANLPERQSNRVKRRRRRRTGKEFRLDAQIDGYDIKDVMLDLGSDVNIMPNKSWEAMGKPKLVYSPIQLRMANQYCILEVGRLEDVEIDLAGVKTYADFEVIEIMGDKDPYPALLGIDWAYENYGIIYLKKETMT
ncbi:retropepsin-like aspartic protease, partial [Parafrankia sp. Ea1.12]|uniref:retropepsin-like aspartic protease n=1 Tax=Parafrankia sp. Ea1.12 TaxID=573499 RepID=UPI001359E34C